MPAAKYNGKSRGIGVRHYQAMMTFVGLSLAYSLRVNLSVGIVAMTDPETREGIKALPWDMSHKGIIVSAFFWGYMMLPILGGHLSRTVGPKYVMFGIMVISSLATILCPYIALNYNWIVFCANRFVIGLAQGAFAPSLNVHIARWAPSSEKNRMFSCIFVGTQVGASLAMLGAGYLAASSWGWPSIFYVTGILSLIWSLFWFFLGADSPDSHPTISDCERDFIKSELIHSSDHSSVSFTIHNIRNVILFYLFHTELF
uniref:Major facilitator superfamily (MFS) profile domain-containing protein n=1 Tax=Graphocephala atropunctata TaxID=36148 RepID=A0A1B6KHT2_9HEMI